MKKNRRNEMIKVLHKKNRIKCCFCGSKLQYDKEDLTPVYYDNEKTEKNVRCYIIKCPVCLGETRVSSKY
jgi:hypothetical protein